METEQIEKMKKLIRKIKITKDNRQEIKDIKNLMKDEEYDEALEILQNLNIRGKLELKDDAKKRRQPLSRRVIKSRIRRSIYKYAVGKSKSNINVLYFV